jgi:hypothetical protein
MTEQTTSLHRGQWSGCRRALTSLSGGECRRVEPATYLHGRSATYVLGEPMADVARLLRARLMAATLLGALRVATHVWLDGPGGAPLAEVVREALREAGDSFG